MSGVEPRNVGYAAGMEAQIDPFRLQLLDETRGPGEWLDSLPRDQLDALPTSPYQDLDEEAHDDWCEGFWEALYERAEQA